VSVDERVKAAFERLKTGRPELSDGRLSVTNVCLEAGVSRASFYRCAQAAEIRQALADPASKPQPEAEELRAQARALQQAETALRAQHATEVRELRATVATYANQIQLLALHAEQLQADNQRLLRRLEGVGDNITRLAAPR
jgi:chromosome segregation ATPase